MLDCGAVMILTDYIIYLLTRRPTRAQAGDEARRLGVRMDHAAAYHRLLVAC